MSSDSKPHLIGITGPSCSGKTKLADHLSRTLAAPVLPLDSYYFDLADIPLEQRAQHNFDIPEALDHELFLEHLASLAAGQSIYRPVYDYVRHVRTGAFELIKPSSYVVVDGLFLLYWQDVRRLLTTKVFLESDPRTCLDRRIRRDVEERGRTPESVILQFGDTVRPMAEQYVYPSRAFADVVVSGDDSVEVSTATVMAHLKRQAQTVSL